MHLKLGPSTGNSFCMIQVGTLLHVIDNSGAKLVRCIKIIKGHNKRYSYVGDLVLVSVKRLRNKRRVDSKVKKGLIYTGLLTSTKSESFGFSGERTTFFRNSVILLNKQKKPVGSRVLCFLPSKLRSKGFLRILSMSNGIIV